MLENVTGIQITREAGVGTGVQIRGTDENRVQINGVATVGSGNGRGGISFEDIDASIISSVEVTKAPDAKTVEGSVGGTINLRTIRPLDVTDRISSIRVQLEESSLSGEGATPRLSGAYANKWDTEYGEMGFVISASHTESDVSHFRPRLDRDNLTECNVDGVQAPASCPAGVPHFLGVQFLNQVFINQEYTTDNLATSFEWQASDNASVYFDAIINNQERRQESSRAQVSNVSRLNGADNANDDALHKFTDFGTANLGTAFDSAGNVINLGSVSIVTAGSFIPAQEAGGNTDRGAPFLRASMDSGSRLTDTQLLRLGTNLDFGKLVGSAEYSAVESVTTNPNLSLTLNFINPNSYRDGTRDENGVPINFDLRNGIAFGIDFDSQYAPTREQLLDPANYVMDSGGTYSNNYRKNSEDTLRADFTYDLDIEYVNSVDFGFRHNTRNSIRDNRSVSAGGTSNFDNSLKGSAIASLLTPIPDNFGAGTGSNLYIKDLLHFDPEQAVNAESFVAQINSAIDSATVPGSSTPISQSKIGTELGSADGSYFDVEEVSTALYGQANFEYGVVRGNFGLRYVSTDFSANTYINKDEMVVDSLQKTSSSHTAILPRLNIVADVRDDLVVRFAYGQDINRPDFTYLTYARTYPSRGGVNDVSRVGNPELKPEEVASIDLSAEWYFAEGSVVSLGYFQKTRTNLFGDLVDQPSATPRVVDGETFTRETDPACPGGGIYSSNTDVGIFGSGRGVCVGDSQRVNVSGETTQSGIEFAVQHSLDQHDSLPGWIQGFGVIFNYTIQEADVNTGYIAIGEGRAIDLYTEQGFTNGQVYREAATLLNLSEDAYNFTLYYEKYGLSARARYTYRSAFRTDDLPGTSNVFDPLGFRGVQEARAQLNLSAGYAITDDFSVNLDIVNLTESDAPISCINEGALLCYQGITDRRTLLGVSYRF